MTTDLPARVAELREIVSDAYLGILVLKTMCKKAGLTGALEVSEQLLKRMEAAMPELPALSALRAKSPSEGAQ